MAEQPLTLASSDFELFAVPRRFAQDPQALDARWKELQREVHPDRFAAGDVKAQRVSLQWSVRINEAYRRLKDPLKRAAYLCELAGVPVKAQDNTAMPRRFLQQQMAWREALEEAGDERAVLELQDEVLKVRDDTLEQCARLLDETGDAAAAVDQVRALMFIERFCSDIDMHLERMETRAGQQVSDAPAGQRRNN